VIAAGAPTGPLSGARILVTRPQHQADALCRALVAAGGIALRLPLLAIVAAADPAQLRRRLEAVRAADWWLFTSVNAVVPALQLLPPPWAANVAAVGAATAAALRAGGVDNVLSPRESFSGAALAALPELQDVGGRRCAIITGADGRDDLAQTLRDRGATVETVVLYRRETVAHDPADVARLIADCDAIVATSAQGLDRLLALLPPPLRKQLLGKQLVVPSPRVVEHALNIGFVAPPLLPDQITDAAFVSALAGWWQRRNVKADPPEP
jgi:uroporphyrinogen-III synthase